MMLSQIVSLSSGTNVTFNPEVVVSNIAGGVVAAFVVAAFTFIIFQGVKWILGATREVHESASDDVFNDKNGGKGW